jgi:hypothetical protein
MSRIALSGNLSGTGTFTIASPNSDSDRILNLPDSAGTLATAESTLTQFSASGSAPVYACRAWVYFNGSGTVAIVGSANVSSITDNGTGNYTVNFTTAMSDANYSCVASTDPTGGSNNISAGPIVFSTGSVQIATEQANGAAIDRSIVTAAIFR